MQEQPGQQRLISLKWGYLSAWGQKHGLKMAVNARLDKARSAYWRSLWKRGRLLVPADGWYEWTGPAHQRQPWYIRAGSGTPLFLAALGKPEAPAESKEHGFVILTDEAAGGLLDVHDRRPVVLDADEARLWLDPETHADQAEAIARQALGNTEDFTWYRVSTEVNRAGVEGAHLIEPLAAGGTP